MTQIEETSAFGLMDQSTVARLLQEAFLTAYIITRCELVAEQLVCRAIQRLETTQLFSSDLIAAVLKLSIEFAQDKRNSGRPAGTNVALGDELAVLMELEAGIRYSYVARVLLDYSLAECVELLKTDAVTITSNLVRAMQCLCEKHRERRNIHRFAAFVNVAGEASKSARVKLFVAGGAARL